MCLKALLLVGQGLVSGFLPLETEDDITRRQPSVHSDKLVPYLEVNLAMGNLSFICGI